MVGFSSVFATPFNAGDLNRGLAGITVRLAERGGTPSVARARPVVTVPQPMVRLIGRTNRQGQLDSLLGENVPDRARAIEGPVARQRLEAAGRFLEGWLQHNSHDDSQRRKGLAALEVVRTHLETEEILFALRNALIPV